MSDQFTCEKCKQTLDESEQCWTCTHFCKTCVKSIVAGHGSVTKAAPKLLERLEWLQSQVCNSYYTTIEEDDETEAIIAKAKGE